MRRPPGRARRRVLRCAVIEWYFLGAVAAGFAFLATRGSVRRQRQEAAADASGLTPAFDLRLHGELSRGAEDVAVTAFDLETLRERRGEWAFLPVEPPFRIGGIVSVVACEVDRAFPHVLLKRVGRGDDNADDNLLERVGSIAKVARDGLGVPRSYPAELPRTLAAAPLDVPLPAQWRAYGDRAALEALAGAGLGAALESAGRRDLVIELIDSLVIVYPAARDVVGADAFADLTATALALVDGVLASSLRVSPRGIEAREP